MADAAGFARSLLGDRFWITALALMAAALVAPGDLSLLAPAVPASLAGILFFSALRIPAGDVRTALADARGLGRTAALAALKLLAIPLFAWAVCRLAAPEWALGVLLVAAMPAGFSSIALTDHYRGDRMAAVLLVCVSSLLVPLSVPLLLAALAPKGAPAWDLIARQAGFLLLMVLAPFAAAQLVRAAAPGAVARGQACWGPCAIACSMALVFIGVAANRSTWLGWPWHHLLAPLALSALPVLLGLASLLLVRRLVAPGPALAWALGATYVNNGLAVTFATTFYAGQPTVLLPCLLIQIPLVLAAAWVGARLRRDG